MGECFFWYRPTRVVPDKRLLNCCVCVLINNHCEPSLDCMQDGLVQQIHICGGLAEQPMTCDLDEKVKLLNHNFCHSLWLMTLSNWNVGSA